MPHVYISYAQQDTHQLAHDLRDAINALADMTAWLDPSGNANNSFEIDRADCMVVLLSPSIHNSLVLDEIAYAQETAHKPIFPVMAFPTTIPNRLAQLNYVDFNGVMELVDAVCELLEAAPNGWIDSAYHIASIIGDPFEWCMVPNRFVIAKYPITFAQFQTFIDADDGIHDDRWWYGLAEDYRQPYAQKWRIADHPRDNVNWYQAIAFCRWLSYQLGGIYDVNQVLRWPVRLPTTSEWRKAAWGTDGRQYPWGNMAEPQKSDIQAEAHHQTTPVGYFPHAASPYGAMDMLGNVEEWCLTPPVFSEEHGLINIATDRDRVLFGGPWRPFPLPSPDPSTYSAGKPNSHFDRGGFRVCASV